MIIPRPTKRDRCIISRLLDDRDVTIPEIRAMNDPRWAKIAINLLWPVCNPEERKTLLSLWSTFDLEHQF
jgi:hypothetical protein